MPTTSFPIPAGPAWCSRAAAQRALELMSYPPMYAAELAEIFLDLCRGSFRKGAEMARIGRRVDVALVRAWYSRYEIVNFLRGRKYSQMICDELADWFVLHFRAAMLAGAARGAPFVSMP